LHTRSHEGRVINFFKNFELNWPRLVQYHSHGVFGSHKKSGTLGLRMGKVEVSRVEESLEVKVEVEVKRESFGAFQVTGKTRKMKQQFFPNSYTSSL
jgi:hypothetical protein